jgi:hypothetical protein
MVDHVGSSIRGGLFLGRGADEGVLQIDRGL